MARQYGVPEIVERHRAEAALELRSIPEAADIFDTRFLDG
jgi:hypothetical protein